MQKITTAEELRAAIRELEDQHYINEQFMRKRVSQIAEDLRPLNLIKALFHQIVKGPEVKTNFLRIAAGLVTSLLVRRFFKRIRY
jgi:hypothetical protein